ncbi:MAG TPA: bifunctional precorrin-2 dehydrogenase/sirohydrochlorin ferrochelatase [Candidatus Binatia bacterium]|nr:bifunctional precorrin-2 dehydrogenase/sirohydrochlorin ferrochelatase [Candidatus Binatia bacterium]
MAEMGYFPVLLELADRRCVMVGGGMVAERRVDGLLAAGARVRVISPRTTRTLAALAAEGRIELESRGYREGDLAGADLAFVATDAGEVNAAVAREARERGLWVNAADDPTHCTFILPALVRRGDLTVAVSTGGSSPALARAIREELEAYLTAEYATLAAIAAEARRELRAAGRLVTADAWRRALGPEVRRLIVERGRDDAKHRLLELLGVEACAR